jgi:hypothetical protein
MTPPWQKGIVYLRKGVKIVSCNFGLYLSLALLYSIPGILSGLIAAGCWPSFFLSGIIGTVLLLVTLSFAPIVVMEAAAKGYEKKRVSFIEATKEAAPWFPRYMWTNVHTSLIFWVPVQCLLRLESLWREYSDPSEGLSLIFSITWTILIVATGLYLHTRTVLAPYLAIHSNLPGTIATVTSWRISGHYFWETLSVFLSGVLPVLILLAGLGFAFLVATGWLEYLVLYSDILSAAGVAVLAQWTRPLLIPAIHTFYVDVWRIETKRRGIPTSASLPWILKGVFYVSEYLFSWLRRIPRFGAYWRF